MKSGFGLHVRCAPRGLLVALATATVLLAARSAPAALIIKAQSVTASAGDKGDTLDVTLTNTGSSAVQIEGFSFRLSTNSADVTFTGAFVATTTAPYIFAGNSTFGPEIDTAAGPTLQASDLYGTDAGVSVNGGATVGLGQVLFNVAPGASAELVTVSLAAHPATSLNGPGPSFNNFPVDTLVSGTITVTGGTPPAVPEPASLTLVGIGAVGLLSYSWRRRGLRVNGGRIECRCNGRA